MALPVEFREFMPTDSRQDLMRKLEAAPQAHAEALLSLVELLQRLHDKELIDAANGLLSASDTVIEKAADVMKSAEVVALLRVTFMALNLLKAIDIDHLHELLSGKSPRSVSLVGIARQLMSRDTQMGLAIATGLLGALGAAVRKQTEDDRGGEGSL